MTPVGISVTESILDNNNLTTQMDVVQASEYLNVENANGNGHLHLGRPKQLDCPAAKILRPAGCL